MRTSTMPLLLTVLLLATFALLPVQANSDNCCHTPGRNCQAMSEWIAGFYAAHAGQCPAFNSGTAAEQSITTPPATAIPQPTAIPEPAAAPQPAANPGGSEAAQSPSASSANNCCHLGWTCSNHNEWVAAYHAFQNNQCSSSNLDQAIKARQQVRHEQRVTGQGTGSPHPVSVTQSLDSNGRNVFTYKYEDGDEIIVRQPTNKEFCDAVERLGQPLPPECQ